MSLSSLRSSTTTTGGARRHVRRADLASSGVANVIVTSAGPEAATSVEHGTQVDEPQEGHELARRRSSSLRSAGSRSRHRPPSPARRRARPHPWPSPLTWISRSFAGSTPSGTHDGRRSGNEVARARGVRLGSTSVTCEHAVRQGRLPRPGHAASSCPASRRRSCGRRRARRRRARDRARPSPRRGRLRDVDPAVGVAQPASARPRVPSGETGEECGRAMRVPFDEGCRP